jgi:arabinofuranosyltransferase
MSSDRLRWLLVGIAAVVLVVHSLAYNFVTDDAFISFVFSRNFAEHGQLAFNLGHPVEGYTNFLWTVVLGVLMIVGISPELSSRVLGTACAIATLVVVFRTCERAFGRRTVWAAVPALLLACSAGFACWTSGGLETQLFTMLVAIAIDGVVAAETDLPQASVVTNGIAAKPRRPMLRVAIALALAAMTRPEGLLIAAVIGAVRLTSNGFAKRWITRADLVAAGAFLVIWAPWFAWRWHYYGWPFPNTYYVKASGPWVDPKMAAQMAESGRYYLWVWLKQTHLLWVSPLVVLGAVTVKPRTPRFVLALACALITVVYLPYAASVGGDFMGLHRFIMPVFVAVAVLLVLGIEWLAERFPGRHFGKYAVPIAASAIVLVFASTQLELTIASTRSCANRNCPNDHGIDSPAFLMVYTEDRAAIGRATAPCFRADDFSIVGGAGAQPYYGNMRGVDVFGLVSETIAHESPRSNPRAGHTKWGSDTLLAAYDPTFVMSCYQIHRGPVSPPLPCNTNFWLQRGFEQVTMFIPALAERGQFYTFLAKKARHFECPGRVR